MKAIGKMCPLPGIIILKVFVWQIRMNTRQNFYLLTYYKKILYPFASVLQLSPCFQTAFQ